MSSKIDWDEVIKKEARGIDDIDLGEVEDISNNYVFTQKNMMDKIKFSIPENKVESYDGNILRLDVTEDEALQKYCNEVELNNLQEHCEDDV